MAAKQIDLSECLNTQKQAIRTSTHDNHTFTVEPLLNVVKAKILWNDYCQKQAAARNPKGAVRRLRLGPPPGNGCLNY